MIMVQKPAHILSSPASHHRRMPSAPPTVLVQPTRTPGLLSLSKPAPSPRPQLRQQGARPRAAQKLNKSGKASVNGFPEVANAQAHPAVATQDSAVQKVQNLAATSSPSEKSNQGRQNGKQTKEKNVPRSSSPNLVRINPRRHPHHQGSPPLPSQIPSQAEVHTSSNRTAFTRSQSHNSRSRNPNANAFDPFLASDSENSASEATRPTQAPSNGSPKSQPSKAAPPRLSARPSGKLARRRQTGPETSGTPTPPPSKSVPVPRGGKQCTREPKGALNLSRSDPVTSAIPARPGLSHSMSIGLGAFPICDDLTEDEDDDVPSPPATPTREKSAKGNWQQSLLDDGPRTAPLASTFAGSPFFPTTTTPSPHKRQHVRSPSEGIFDMSMDETTSSSSDASDELKALMGLLPRRRHASAASTPVGLSKSANKPGFFASSNFQNSPSPDDLPPPAFGF